MMLDAISKKTACYKYVFDTFKNEEHTKVFITFNLDQDWADNQSLYDLSA